jgi:dihydropyrimidinase
MLIRGGTVVTATAEWRADILVEGQRIAAVGDGLRAADDAPIIDAEGLYVLPGVVDPHTHFSLDTGSGRTADDFVSGTASAAAGGVTTYINFATQHPGQDFRQALAAVREQAEGCSYVDFGLHLNVTRLHEGWERELEQVVAAGVSSAKVYTTYKGTVFYVDDWTIFRLMERSGGAGLLVQMHAENDDILEGRKQELVAAGRTSLAYHGTARPAVAESEAVARGIFFCRVTGSPIYFVHLSSPLSVDLVAEARRQGLSVIAETCPHFLLLDDRVYQGPEAIRYLMTPPIRSAEMQAALWERVATGRIHSLGSDHCGYSLTQRGASGDFREVSPGIPGVETLLPLIYSDGVARGRLDMPALVQLTSANPARIFGLAPRKGTLAPGADADLVLFDPRATGPLRAQELHSASGYSPYEGLDLQGRVRATISRGRVIYERGRITGDPTWGRFLQRAPFDAAASLA